MAAERTGGRPGPGPRPRRVIDGEAPRGAIAALGVGVQQGRAGRLDERVNDDRPPVLCRSWHQRRTMPPAIGRPSGSTTRPPTGAVCPGFTVRTIGRAAGHRGRGPADEPARPSRPGRPARRGDRSRRSTNRPAASVRAERTLGSAHGRMASTGPLQRAGRARPRPSPAPGAPRQLETGGNAGSKMPGRGANPLGRVAAGHPARRTARGPDRPAERLTYHRAGTRPANRPPGRR